LKKQRKANLKLEDKKTANKGHTSMPLNANAQSQRTEVRAYMQPFAETIKIKIHKMNDKEIIEQEEKRLSEEDDFNEQPPSDIVAYNELRSCAELLRMYKNNQLIIKPDFQRDIVWSKPSQTRFIDSLIKQLPIPSLCISLDFKTQKRLVIDGLQRVSSIINFLSEEDWRLSSLEDIDQKISGKTNNFIKERYTDFYERVENLTIPVTILRCDYSKKSHMNYLFTIFHRLNTGGNKLNNQEIRNCIFQSDFNELLKDIVKSKVFVQALGIDEKVTHRFVYEELVLRIITFYSVYEKYNGRLAKFLNDFMDDNKNAESTQLSNWRTLLERTTKLIYDRIYEGSQISDINKTTIEGLFVGVARNIDKLETQTDQELRELFKNFRQGAPFSTENLKAGLSQKDKVLERFRFSIETFNA